MAFGFLRDRSGRVRLAVLVIIGAIVAGALWWRLAANVPPSTPAEPAVTASSGAGHVTTASPTSSAGIKPSLSVRVVEPQREDWPVTLSVDGNVMAWQEAVIGAELGQYRITSVAVQVGDTVRKGQVLAHIADDVVASELAEARASVEELEGAAAEAKGNAERAQALRAQGFYSTQMQTQYATTERTATARLAAARARLQSAELRMRKTSVTAPDDGVISARTATVGSLTQQGQELFRLIRGGRLEWQAEIVADTLPRVKPGAAAFLTGPNGVAVKGTVRAVAPSVDPRTRNGIVFVDLRETAGLRAGMFARGEIEMGRASALILPQSSVVLREGFAYVFRIVDEAGETETRRVAQVQVKPGRRVGERIEIVEGLAAGARVVESGAGFLADGDVVRVVANVASAASAGKTEDAPGGRAP